MVKINSFTESLANIASQVFAPSSSSSPTGPVNEIGSFDQLPDVSKWNE